MHHSLDIYTVIKQSFWICYESNNKSCNSKEWIIEIGQHNCSGNKIISL